ncbi:MAG: NAD(P)-dependent oxidoreductase [Sarcina sp.]
MIKILFNDGVEAGLKKDLEKLGVVVDENHYEAEYLVKRLNEVDAVVIRSATKIKKDLIDKIKGGSLGLIVRAGVGVDNIDVSYAMENDIEVRNTPFASSASVAELVIAHMFALARFIPQSNITMRKGEWNKKLYTGIEISGKTLGILGMGRIGQSLAVKATALGMNVIYSDSVGAIDSAKDYDYVAIDELYRQSDFISIHVPSTECLIGDEEMKKMKDGVFLINTARGSVIDINALLIGLDTGKISGVGLDVFDNEPKFHQGLVNNKRVSATPHIGASTKEAQERIAEEIYNIVKDTFKLS